MLSILFKKFSHGNCLMFIENKGQVPFQEKIREEL